MAATSSAIDRQNTFRRFGSGHERAGLRAKLRRAISRDLRSSDVLDKGRSKGMRRFFISIPYLWLQCCFFQPLKFKQDFESKLLSQRLGVMLRLMPLLFLYAYTPALVIRIISYTLR